MTMVNTSAGRRAARASVAVMAATALLLSSCAESDSSGDPGSTAGQEGVEFGASMDEYHAAFAGIDPIEIHTQSSAAKGAASSRKFEDYFAAVTEWSDGKIVFDIQYSNAIAGPTEVDDALRDGRLGLGSVLPLYEPSEYPANAALIDSMIIADQTPVGGLLQLHGWMNEVGFGTEEIRQEFEDRGMHMLLPGFGAGSTGLLCKDEARNTADKTKGAQVTVSTTAMTEQIKALGSSPVSMAYPEIFESLQRGVVDCAASIMSVAVLGGFIEQAPHTVIDEEVGLAQGHASLAVSSDVWEGLPLVAQQLLFDRLDAFLEANFTSTWDNIVEASKQVDDSGGEFVQFDEELRSAISRANETILDGIRESEAVGDGEEFVDAALRSSEEWTSAVADLGLEGETDYNRFFDSYEPGSIDLEPYFEKLFTDVLLEHRPS
jgi:TRAP-type C4-dicarboxylate transport system substrate-binding protein